MKKAIELFFLNTSSYFLLTVDVRSVAQANILIALITNALLATLSFSIVKRISGSKGLYERIAYTLSGCTGVLLGIYISKLLLGK